MNKEIIEQLDSIEKSNEDIREMIAKEYLKGQQCMLELLAEIIKTECKIK